MAGLSKKEPNLFYLYDFDRTPGTVDPVPPYQSTTYCPFVHPWHLQTTFQLESKTL